jgi:tetratricopeptide (TPR) repeat protein
VGGPDAALGSLDELVESSIVHSDGEGLRLLEVVREYAQALPSADAEGARLHATYFLELAEAAEPELVGPDQGAWLTTLEHSHDDLRAALEWFGTSGESTLELRLAAALGRFWYVRGYLSEGLGQLQRAAARAGDASPELTANALRSASALAVLLGDYVQARTLVERALRLYRTLGNASGVVRSLSNLGAVLHGLGELDAAAATLDECVRAAESLGEPRLIALARNNRGDVALSQGDLETARTEFEQSLALLRPANDLANIARSLYNLGAVAVKQGRLEAAGDLLVEALDLSNEVDDKEDIAWCLIALSALGALSGRSADAALVLGFARTLPAEIGATIKPSEQQLHDDVFARLSVTFTESERDRLLRSGELMASTEVVAIARSLGA